MDAVQIKANTGMSAAERRKAAEAVIQLLQHVRALAEECGEITMAEHIDMAFQNCLAESLGQAPLPRTLRVSNLPLE